MYLFSFESLLGTMKVANLYGKSDGVIQYIPFLDFCQ